MAERLQQAPINKTFFLNQPNLKLSGPWLAFFRDLRIVKSDRDEDATDGDWAVFNNQGNPRKGENPDIGPLIHDLLEHSTGIRLAIDTETGIITITATLDDFDSDSLEEGGSNLYFTGSRVNSQVNSYLEQGQNIALSAGSSTLTVATSGVKQSRTLQKDDDYIVTVSDITSYETIRMYAATNKMFTLPSVGADEDGLRVRILNAGNARLSLQAPDSDKIGDSAAAGLIYTDDSFGALNLEYSHSNETWFILGAYGTWQEVPLSEHLHLEDLAGDVLLEDGSYASLEDTY